MDTLTEPRWTVEQTEESDWAPPGRPETDGDADFDCTGDPTSYDGDPGPEVATAVTAFPPVDELPPLARPCKCGDDILDHEHRDVDQVVEILACMVDGCPCQEYDEDPDPARHPNLAEVVGPELAERIGAQVVDERARREAEGSIPDLDEQRAVRLAEALDDPTNEEG